MARGIPHDKETKAQVIAALLAGQSIDKAADAYNIPPETVKLWKRECIGHAHAEFGPLLAIYVKRCLETLTTQAEHMADKAWLKDQNAADLAVCHGVLADKTVRILEAVEKQSAAE